MAFTIVNTAEFANPDYLKNDGTRCYHCKSELFDLAVIAARKLGFPWIADGTITDDLGEHRPGLRAAEEHGVIHPLVEAGFDLWRQERGASSGRMVLYQVQGIDPNMSFLEMFDQLNEDLLRRGEDPVAIDSDCREGICGMCGFVVNGYPHGPQPLTTVCQLHMRFFHDGDVLRLEPFRAKAFPIIKDLVTDVSFNFEVAKKIPAFQGPPQPEGVKPSSVWCVTVAPSGQTMFIGTHSGARIVPVPAPASSTRAMFGWFIMASACRSDSNRPRIDFVSMPSLISLTATRRCTGSFCSAR